MNRRKQEATLTNNYIIDNHSKLLNLRLGGKSFEYINTPLEILNSTQKNDEYGEKFFLMLPARGAALLYVVWYIVLIIIIVFYYFFFYLLFILLLFLGRLCFYLW